VTSLDDSARSTFRARLQLFAWIMFGQSAAFDLLSALQAVGRGATTFSQVVGTRRELGANLVLLLIALVTRYARLSTGWLKALDPTVLWVTTGATILMALDQPGSAQPGLMNSIATMPLVVVRAALIPSSPLRTLFITAIAAAPGFLVAGVVPLVLHTGTVTVGNALDVAIWWLVQVAVATLTSKIIYGLRQRIREAEEFGQYRLERKIGQGGMGVVYRAEHALLRRPTAVKLLGPDQLGKESLARFAREVRVTARLSHPNVITVYDYGRTPDGIFYYAMELLEGIDLNELVRTSGPVPASRLRHVLLQAGEALAAAHGVGLIHRDVKPGNIMLSPVPARHELVKLLDFGLVRDVAEVDGGGHGALPMGGRSARAAATELSDPERTRAGERSFVGTPLFMAPEAIARPADVEPRSDLYSLAAVGYFLWTGGPVFSGATVGQICEHHLRSQPLRPSLKLGVALPASLEDLIMRCLAKRPEERVPSALQFVRELSALSDVDAWTAEDAEAWWRTYAASRARSGAGVASPGGERPPGGTVLTIDLRNR
jgi:hypothetical protein